MSERQSLTLLVCSVRANERPFPVAFRPLPNCTIVSRVLPADKTFCGTTDLRNGNSTPRRVSTDRSVKVSRFRRTDEPRARCASRLTVFRADTPVPI